MEILLPFVLIISFGFCQSNGQDCAQYNENAVGNQYQECSRNSGTCKYEVTETDRLTFIDCDDISRMNEIIAQVKNVRIVDISQLKYQSIDDIDVQHSQHLKRLIASHNTLETFPGNRVSKASTIEEIDLAFNSFKHIGIDTFYGISTLKIVNLSYNEIASIDKDAFIALKDLKMVDLRRNVLVKLEPIRFCPGCGVDLRLEDNFFDELNAQYFRIERNISIFASWPRIKHIDLRNHLGRFFVVKDNYHDAILADSRRFYHEIHCADGGFTQIESLAIGQCQIENLSIFLQCIGGHIQTLHLSGNFLGVLNHFAFQRFRHLKHLYIANTQLVAFDFKIVNAMQIHQLDLSTNGLTYLANVYVLKKFHSMTSFKAAGNNIKNIPELIRDLPSQKLQSLDLSDNFIGPINRTTFERFTNLQDLKLRNTQISIANFNPFERFDKLKEFDISYNSIERVNITGMTNILPRLIRFHASHCEIRKASAVMRLLGNCLEELDLSGNHLIESDLNADLFAQFERLRFLNLSKTHLKHFAPNTIVDLCSMVVFDLSENQLREFDFSFMSRTTEKLYINNNGLKKVANLNQQSFITPIQINIENNCLSDNFVMEIVQNLSSSSFLTDPFHQNLNGQCNVHGKQAIAIIVILFATTIAINVCICFIDRRYSNRKLRAIKHKASEMATETNAIAKQPIQTIAMPIDDRASINEPVYEELDDLAYVRYDKLWHEFQPMPLQTQQSYVVVSNSNRCTGT